MHIGDEARETLVKGSGAVQVDQDRAGHLSEALAGHDQRDPGSSVSSVLHLPLVIPIENSTKKLYKPVFSTTSPRSQRNLPTTSAGIPWPSVAPAAPGITRVTLSGSSNT
ncbi:hypothetical protein WR25_07304 [Diploscapter pachys]|uniref:Uncharacterized protein n=1 Tax=Diploscapter pachys TaxID=2018661 RepID=A0A2A2KGR6_9BILA|nr:hypothetical protein WR25_07304 [Diploscapter pachys]